MLCEKRKEKKTQASTEDGQAKLARPRGSLAVGYVSLKAEIMGFRKYTIMYL